MESIQLAFMAKISLLFASFVLISAGPDGVSVDPDRMTGSRIDEITETRVNDAFIAEPVLVNWIYLKWNVTDEENMVRRYSFWYRIKGALVPHRFEDRALGDAFEYYVNATKLKKGVDYEVGIYAVNTTGNYPVCGSQYITTLKEDYVLKPAILESNDTSITIKWTPIPIDQRVKHTYEVHMHQVNNETNSRDVMTKGNRAIFNNLTPDTSYQFKIRIEFSPNKLYSNWSNEIEGHTTKNGINKSANGVDNNFSHETEAEGHMTKNVTNMSANLHPLEIDVKIQVRAGGFLTIFNINSRKIQSSTQID